MKVNRQRRSTVQDSVNADTRLGQQFNHKHSRSSAVAENDVYRIHE